MNSLLLLSLATVLSPAAAVQVDSRPNIVLIIADDLGYSDVGFNGGTEIPTPNIDSIAATGVRFDQGYVCAAVCAPSRAGMLTGMYPQRFGFYYNQPIDPLMLDVFGLQPTQTTVAQRLRPLGYQTALFGKWHLGYAEGKVPNDKSYDQFWGFLDHSDTYLADLPALRPFYEDKDLSYLKEYQTDEIGARACDWIKSHASKSFFLTVPFGAVHQPMQATPKYKSRFPNLTGPRLRMAAMTSALDDNVGRIISALRRTRTLHNTLLIFVGDNGGLVANGSDNAPFRGGKNTLFEGGLRVPFAMSWPKRFQAGTTYRPMVSALDIAPTIMAAVGLPFSRMAGIDGVSLTPFLRSESPNTTDRPHDALYWNKGDQWGIREGNYKYVRTNLVSAEEEYFEFLFDVAGDPSETTNLLDAKPEVVKALKRKWNRWNKDNIPPLWWNDN